MNDLFSDAPHDPYYPPVIALPPEIRVDDGEGQEEVLLELRAKLFRFCAAGPEWKERGTGKVKLLKHKDNGNIRMLMRRDRTLKPCANHSVQPWMQLRASKGSDRAFVWSVAADFADGKASPELLAIRFATVDNANKFKAKVSSTQDCHCLSYQYSKNYTGSRIRRY